jgi:hypothetical protein
MVPSVHPLHRAIVAETPMVRFCPDCLYDITVLGMLEKLSCIAAVVFILLALMPAAVIGQNLDVRSATADQVRLSDAERRLDRLDTLPERMATMEASVIAVRSEVDTLSTRAWLILAAACAALLDRLLSVFGVKIRDRTAV